jgi:hypothetical protein
MQRFDDDLLDRLARRFEPPAIEQDPVVWANNALGVKLYSMQRTILRLIEIVPKLAVPSCHSSGKTKTAAIAAARFIAKYPPGTARVVTTAPSGSQVRGVIWNEINALFDRANSIRPGSLPGRVNQTEWWIGNWMAGVGRKPRDRPQTDDEVRAPETFQGLHAEHLLVIVDEAGGVPDELWIGVDTLATNVGAHILAIGNPDDPNTEFRNVVEKGESPDETGAYSDWTVVRIPAWKTPNLSGEVVDPLLNRVLLSKTWVEDKRTRWGEDSGLWAAKIAAQFPDESQLIVVRVADIAAARRGIEFDGPVIEDVQLGVDIAGSETGDETVVRERRGRRILRRWACRSGEPEVITELIVQAQMESGATLLHVDATGVGFGFLSDIRKEIPGVAVLPFVAAARAIDTKQFENRRAEAYWYTRDELRRGRLDMSDMEDPDEVVAQLTSVRYRLKNGKIIVEPKDQIRRRMGRSPDDGDALLLSVLPPQASHVPAAASARSASRRRREHESITQEQQSTDVVVNLDDYRPHPVAEQVVPADRLGHSLHRRRRRTIVAR